MFVLISAVVGALGAAFYSSDMGAALENFEREHDRPE